MAGSDSQRATADLKHSAGFRPDIEGLRAVAIGLVLVYHAGISFVPGGFVGVDVFFVISGFLITGLLVREVERSGRVSLSQFWARRAKRLLPASALMLVTTAIASWLLVPMTQWRAFGQDISASALYVVNWRFAAEAVDYDAEGAGVSPVLHFWSLAVEEQFYIVWPLLIVAVVALARRARRSRLRAVLGAAIALIVVPSFVWSVLYTASNPDTAFFVTTTRLWELGIGASVAIGAHLWPRVPGAIAHVLGWLGAAAIAAAALRFSSETPWPGAGALLPTLGTAAVIVATTGRAPGVLGVGRLLGLRPMVWVGGLSYSWYLWHWPFLVLGQAAIGGELGERRSVLLVLASGLVAWLSLKLVENPLRFAPSLAASPRLALSLGGNFSLVGALAGAALVLAVPASVATAAGSALGARFLETAEFKSLEVELATRDTSSAILPAPTDARLDLPEAQLDKCVSAQTTKNVVECEYGDPEGSRTVVLVGDSKILQWTDAIIPLAEREGWRLVTYLRSACAFAEPSYERSEPEREGCAQWNLEVIERILQLSPEVVVTTGRTVFDGVVDKDRSPGAQRIAAWWQRLLDAGIGIVPLLDNPDPGFEVYDCVAENLERLSECSFDRDKAIERSGAGFQLLAAQMLGIESTVDMADVVCPGVERCPAVIGDVLVYRQGSHLTRTFVESATDALAERLVPAVEAAARD